MEIRRVGGNLPDMSLVHADEHVLRLDVRVDDLTFRVKIVQSFQYLGMERKRKLNPCVKRAVTQLPLSALNMQPK